MASGFYFKTAFRNIRNSKKQSVLFVFGIIVSITLLISLRLWSSTAEDLAARDFLEDQDFELRVTSYMPDDLPFIIQWLESEPLVKNIYRMYNNLACFNAENKPDNYIWSPEDQQGEDPLSITALGLFPKEALERIRNQFYVEGSWDIGLNECLISEFEAQELKEIYGYDIEPGMNLTLSVARNSPELGQVFVHQLELKHYQNVTVKGIYRTIPSISLLQKSYSASFLKDSVIFLSENLDDTTILEMQVNGIEPNIFVKTEVEELKKDGIDSIITKLEDLTERLKLAFISSQFILLESPTISLQQSYTLAQSAVVFIVPVVTLSILLTLFTINIVIETRKEQILTLKDRGAQNWQVIGLILAEFLILTLIGIIIAIGISFVVASFIPTLASGSFSGAVFKEFITKVQFPFSLALYVILGTTVIITSFTLIKLQTILNTKLEERLIKKREKAQRIGLLVSIIGVSILTIILLIVYAIRLQNDTAELFNFTIDQAQSSMLVFLLIILLLFLLGLGLAFLFDKILGKLKKIYRRLFINNSFFVTDSLKQSKNKLTPLLIIFILLASFNFFSLNIYKVLLRNETAEDYYNNGADLRIHTSYVNLDYSTNLSTVNGINEIMPVLSAEGRLIYNDVTVFGIDPIIYGRIGRWDTETVNQNEITAMMQKLNSSDDGIIVSDFVANRLNLQEDSLITITGLPNSSYVESFRVKGVIHSAPGLGLTYGINIELNQPNQEFVLINQRTMTQEYAVEDTNLFFASKNSMISSEEISDDLLELSEVLDVNPQTINPQFVGKYISEYIPNVRNFLLIQIILMNVIGLIIIIISADFIIKQRDQKNAVLNTLGNSNNNLIQIILSELLVIELTAFLIAFLIAIPASILSVFINRPSFTSHNIIAYKFSVDYIGIPIFILAVLLVTVIAIIPAFVRFTRRNISVILRD